MSGPFQPPGGSFLANALVAHIYLKENVDRRRWMAALCVACGVALLAR